MSRDRHSKTLAFPPALSVQVKYLRAPSADLSPTKTPSHKRKVAFDGPIDEEDEEFDALATPCKRQKFSSPIKPLTATPRSSSRIAAVLAARVAEDEPLPLRSGRTLDASTTTDHAVRAVFHTRGKPTVDPEQEDDSTDCARGAGGVPPTRFKGDARLERELRP
ncbi:hypothetical protein K466DRAFT_662478 [Polyporus arcularius HHB13444]|uniref:Uncharacterized protein n=1 Tax=Polyporus arcularius HHB13444 TaxID=1314778 RepID=A0A5C3PF08_9APHY|nr:hypothetical protein K466DRAFT_662478 [Polyporus arcularius HHB13444]